MTPLVYLTELVENDPEPAPGTLTMPRAIRKMADEVVGVNMLRHHGRNRALAMVQTKLEEARLWAIQYGEDFGSEIIMPKTEILRIAHADTTGTTVAGDTADV